LFLISISFHPYFIWNFWSRGRHLLDRSKFWPNLNPFEILLIRFKTESGGTMLPGPHVSAAPRRARPAPLAPAGRGPMSAARAAYVLKKPSTLWSVG
jgi:hypothetical protein